MKRSRKIIWHLKTINILNEEWYIPGDLNISISKNCTLFTEKNKNTMKGTNKISSETKRYLEFYQNFGFKQIIQSPTRVMHNTTTLLNYILTNTFEKMVKCGIINIGMSDQEKQKKKK